MSKHVAECAKCHKRWNLKFNRRCPHCGGLEVVREDAEPVTPEAIQQLKEHFSRG